MRWMSSSVLASCALAMRGGAARLTGMRQAAFADFLFLTIVAWSNDLNPKED